MPAMAQDSSPRIVSRGLYYARPLSLGLLATLLLVGSAQAADVSDESAKSAVLRDLTDISTELLVSALKERSSITSTTTTD